MNNAALRRGFWLVAFAAFRQYDAACAALARDVGGEAVGASPEP